MYQQILAPLDGSAAAAQVLPLVTALAADTRSTLVLLRVLEPDRDAGLSHTVELKDDEQRSALGRQEFDAFEKVRGELAAAGVPVKLAVRFGAPATTILDYAEREQIDLIAMATRGRTGLTRLVFGSVTDAVLCNGSVPLLVMRSSDKPRAAAPHIKRILVPLDGSTLAESALPHARQLAAALDAEVILYAIWDTFGYPLAMAPRDELEAEMHDKHAMAKRYLIAKADGLQAGGVRAHWQLQSGLIVESIVAAAEQQAVSLIVMSTHGRRGLNRWLDGSIASEVLRATDIPLLLIRGPTLRAA